MKLQEAFLVQEPRATLWEFFEQVDRVARCVPGVEEVTVVDPDTTRVRIAQSLGPMSAVFDLRMQVTDRTPGTAMEFTTVGRSVRGAVGHVRAANRVNLEEVDADQTRVVLDTDIALGGMIGSVGQKVVAKQARTLTQSFAAALERELSGEPAPAAGAEAASGELTPAGPPPAAGAALAPSGERARLPESARLAIAAGLGALLALVAVRGRSGR